MTVSQMCAALGGVSRRTFYRWRELGDRPPMPEDPERRAAGLAQRLPGLAGRSPRGCRMKSHSVRFWEIRPNKTAKGVVLYGPVDGRGPGEVVYIGQEGPGGTIQVPADAGRRQGRSVRRGHRPAGLDGARGILGDLVPARLRVRRHARWPKVAAKGRISLVEGLMAVTPVLVTSTRGTPDPERAPSGDAQMGIQSVATRDADAAEIEAALRWLARSSVPVSALQEASIVEQGAGRVRPEARRLGGGSRVLPASSAHVLRRAEIRGAREASFGKPARRRGGPGMESAGSLRRGGPAPGRQSRPDGGIAGGDP